MAEARRLDADAAAARGRAEQARRAVGAVSRALAVFGITTPAQQTAEAAEDAAVQAEVRRCDGRELREHFQAAEAAARVEAARRQQQHQAWRDRPDVRAAEREALGNRLVLDALRRRDPVVRCLAEASLDAARVDVLRRHQDGLRRAEEQRRAAEARAAMARRQHTPRDLIPALGMRR